MFKNAKKLFAKAFMVLLAASFLTWGANSYFVNTPKSIAIEVNGEKVPVSELQTEYNFRLREAERQFGGKLSPEFLQTIRLGNATVNRLITSKLSLDIAKDLGFRSSPEALRTGIINNPAFQDADGNFNKEIYRQSVSNYGYTASGYEKILKEEMEKKYLYGIFSTEFIQKNYLQNLYKHQNAEMTIRTLMLNNDEIGETPAITAEEIKNHYNSNSHRFTADETRDFTTLVLRADKLKETLNITDADALKIYNEDPDGYSSEEERQARHILVDSEETALDLIYQLDKGADFAILAQEKSTDAFTKDKGGDLGYFVYSDMVENFSDAAFNMEINAISEPVKSPFGYHIIQLLNIKEAQPQNFENVKDDIIAEIETERSEDLYYDLLDKVEDKIATGAHLDAIAKDLNLKSSHYKKMKETDTSVDFSVDILPVVFSLNEGEISDPVLVEGQDTVTIFAELNKLNKEHTLNIEEAREKIVYEITKTKQQALLSEKAQKLLIERQSKNSLNEVASKHNLTSSIFKTANISRQGEGAPKWLQQMHINLLFAMNNGQVLSSLVNTPDGLALVELVTIKQKEANTTELELYRNQVSNAWQEDLFEQYMQKKRQEANITVNESSIKFALGSAFVSE